MFNISNIAAIRESEEDRNAWGDTFNSFVWTTEGGDEAFQVKETYDEIRLMLDAIGARFI